MFDDAVVDPFVMTANDDEMFFSGKSVRDRLSETAALRSHEHDCARVRAKRLDCGEDRLRFHYHALTPTEGRVVDDMVPVARPVAQIVDPQVESSGFLGAAHHALA